MFKFNRVGVIPSKVEEIGLTVLTFKSQTQASAYKHKS